MKRCGDSTHPCRSPTPSVNDSYLTLLTRAQTSEQEYSDLTASNRRLSTPYTHNTLQSFSRRIRSNALLRSTKLGLPDAFCNNTGRFVSNRARISPVSLGGEISVIQYLANKSHYGFNTVRQMKYSSQHCCDKTMNGQIALYRECCFPVFRIVKNHREKSDIFRF